jgi:hypothetical protein
LNDAVKSKKAPIELIGAFFLLKDIQRLGWPHRGQARSHTGFS